MSPRNAGGFFNDLLFDEEVSAVSVSSSSLLFELTNHSFVVNIGVTSDVKTEIQ